MSTQDCTKDLHEEAARVFAEADCLHDTAVVSAAYDRLATQIAQRVSGKNPLILPVMLGGIYAAAEITRRLSFPFQMDYLHATRYRNQTRGGDLVWKVAPATSLSGRSVVVIDDILDEGYTFKAIVDALQAQQPAELITVALVEKLHDRRAPGARVDLVGVQTPDRYLFGCGMDYKGYLRQYPAIYAVKGL